MEASLLVPECTLVPSHFFDPSTARNVLSEVSRLKESDTVGYIGVDEYDAVLIYRNSISGEQDALPEMFHILRNLSQCREYNKILCSWSGGYLYMAIAQGKTLLLANTYKAPDFTTAEYYIFLALKSLQLNPEVSTICWRMPIGTEEEMSLYRYFKAVEQL